jgi:hypothetical protein
MQVAAALAVMAAAYLNAHRRAGWPTAKISLVMLRDRELLRMLLAGLAGPSPLLCASAWALRWIFKDQSDISRETPYTVSAVAVERLDDETFHFPPWVLSSTAEHDALTARQLAAGAARRLHGSLSNPEVAGVDLISHLVDDNASADIVMGALVQHLDGPDVDIQVNILRVCRHAYTAQWEPSIRPMLRHGSPRIRIASLAVVAAAPTTSFIRDVTVALRDPNSGVREAAATTLADVATSGRLDGLPVDVVTDLLEPVLGDTDDNVAGQAARAVARVAGDHAMQILSRHRYSASERIRCAVVEGLASLCEDETDRRLLTRDSDGVRPFRDPAAPIIERDVTEAARRLKLDEPEVHSRFERLAARFDLTYAWSA